MYLGYVQECNCACICAFMYVRFYVYVCMYVMSVCVTSVRTSSLAPVICIPFIAYSLKWPNSPCLTVIYVDMYEMMR